MRQIDVIAMQFLLVQNKHQTHDWTLIGSGANGLGIQKCTTVFKFYPHTIVKHGEYGKSIIDGCKWGLKLSLPGP